MTDEAVHKTMVYTFRSSINLVKNHFKAEEGLELQEAIFNVLKNTLSILKFALRYALKLR